MTVEIRTSSSLFSGTDDDVYLRISPTLRFALDKRLYNDFERGDRDTYSVPIDDAVLDGLTVGDIDRVQIEKSPDGVGGGWKLRGVKLVVNGRDALRARRHRALARGQPPHVARAGLPAHVAERARRCRSRSTCGTRTRSSTAATTTATSSRFDRRKRLALAYVPGTPAGSDRATGGSRLGGRLGDGDKASVTYTIETLTPTRRPAEPAAGRRRRRSCRRRPPPPPPPGAEAGPRDQRHGLQRSRQVLLHGQEPGRRGDAGRSRSASPMPGPTRSRRSRRARRRRGPSASSARSSRTLATADVFGEVAESDETNNTRSFTEDTCIV